DYLELAGTSYCGTFANRILMFEFTTQNFLINFHSNGDALTGKGFRLDVRQIEDGCPIGPIQPPVPPGLCDVSTQQQGFTLLSPSYPVAYPVNTDCLTQVIKASQDVRSLQLELVDFDLESSSGCQADYLEVEGADRNERLCGILSGQSRTYQFVGDSINLRFHTDADAIGGRGYRIKVGQLTSTSPIPGNCGGYITGEKANVVSPSYPSLYPGNSNCVYQVTKISTDVCYLAVKILDFDLENSYGCQQDYLQVGQQELLCGKRRSGETRHYHFTENTLALTFHSDSGRSGRGFSIEVIQQECGHFHPNYGKYPPSRPTYPPSSPTYPPSKPTYPSTQTTYPSYKPTKPSYHSTKPTYPSIFRPVKPILKPWFKHWWKFVPFSPAEHRHNHQYNNSPSKFYAKPSHSYGAPSNSYSAPSNSYGAPSSYYGPPEPSYKPPSNHYGAPSSSYGPPSQKYVTPSSSYSPPGNTYGPPDTLYGPPKSDNDLYFHPISVTTASPLFVTSEFPKPFSPSPKLPEPLSVDQSNIDVSKNREILRNSANSTSDPSIKDIEIIYENRGQRENTFNPSGVKKKKECIQYYDSEAFTLQSPGYPGPYYIDMSCKYIIRRQSSEWCEVVLQVDLFDVEETNACVEAHLTLNGRRYCGTVTNSSSEPSVIPFNANASEIVLEFHAGRFHSGAGFSIRGKQKKCFSATGTLPSINHNGSPFREPLHNTRDWEVLHMVGVQEPRQLLIQVPDGSVAYPWVGPGGREDHNQKKKSDLKNIFKFS
ncbi:unnamed protein product, partial [Meganyctiphanes norvegica]